MAGNAQSRKEREPNETGKEQRSRARRPEDEQMKKEAGKDSGSKVENTEESEEGWSHQEGC